MPTVSEPDGYCLLRNDQASFRLNLQHYLWKQTCGFNLHPNIPIPANGCLKVADVATGTGIWIWDVLRDYPSFEVDGFDISLDQCPPPELFPKGCSIRQLDLLSDIPENLKNRYDVVNLRLFIGAIEDDPVPTLRSLMALLKPGGYLQWQELNLTTISVHSINDRLDKSTVAELLNEVQHFSMGSWAPRLAQICEENGMLESRTYAYRVPLELSVAWCQSQFAAFEEISMMTMDNSSTESKGPRFRRLVERAYKDLYKGIVLDVPLEVTIARKPSADESG